jgi:hypothetical protein
VDQENTPVKTVSVPSFWMDDTEITNNEYRQFVYWVRDSMARQLLSESIPEFLVTEGSKGKELETPRLNWQEPIEWDNPDYAAALEPMFIPENERFFKRKELDARKLNYEYTGLIISRRPKGRTVTIIKHKSMREPLSMLLEQRPPLPTVHPLS